MVSSTVSQMEIEMEKSFAKISSTLNCLKPISNDEEKEGWEEEDEEKTSGLQFSDHHNQQIILYFNRKRINNKK